MSRNRSREWRETKRAEGLCARCGVELALPNRTHCERCTNKRRRWLEVRRTKGLCVQCGVGSATRNRAYCEQCTDKYRRRREDKRVKGLCMQCGYKSPRAGLTTCQSCADRRSRQQKENRISTRRRHLIKQYGLSLDDYDRMFGKQGGVCAICGQPETRRYRGEITNLVVDHDHKTGRIRGLLCSRCNVRLDELIGDLDWPKRATQYVGIVQ